MDRGQRRAGRDPQPRRRLDQSGKIAATPAGSFVVEDGGNAVTSPPGQGFGAPVNIAPSSSIMQLTAAAGHALAILAVGGGLSAATEPVT